MPPPYRDNPGSDSEHDESTFQTGRRRAQRMFDGFLDFALQGNILEIAFGLMYVLFPAARAGARRAGPDAGLDSLLSAFTPCLAWAAGKACRRRSAVAYAGLTLDVVWPRHLRAS